MSNQDIKLNESRKFTGEYRGVHFLISHHGKNEKLQPHGIWCYYVLVNEQQLPNKYRDDFVLKPEFDDKGRVHYGYMSAPIADLNWHSGITYYSKEGGADGEKITIKMGCDYNHYWDEGMMEAYNEAYLLSDVKGSIDALHHKYPDLKLRSSWSGEYCHPSEGELNKHGNFISFADIKKQDEWHKEREAKKAANQ